MLPSSIFDADALLLDLLNQGDYINWERNDPKKNCSGGKNTKLYSSTVTMCHPVEWEAQPTDEALAANTKRLYWWQNARSLINPH